jgi:hypothetical protein
MPIPDYIDNSTHTLESILKQLIEDENQHILEIATGFFRIEAWQRLEKSMIFGQPNFSFLITLRAKIRFSPAAFRALPSLLRGGTIRKDMFAIGTNTCKERMGV